VSAERGVWITGVGAATPLGNSYRAVADGLLAGARAALVAAGARHETVEVPGALEIPTTIALAARSGDFDGFVALGCVIRGETTHYETVCNDSSRGLTLLGLKGVCIGNGILTVENTAQAAARADPAPNTPVATVSTLSFTTQHRRRS
jgi:6,7-dimethyl-8-ribityllumazine synthase